MKIKLLNKLCPTSTLDSGTTSLTTSLTTSFLAFVLSLCFSQISLAQYPEAESTPSEPEVYYTVLTEQHFDQSGVSEIGKGSAEVLNPLNLLSKLGSQMLASVVVQAPKLDLLKWVRHLGHRESPQEPYNRLKHFGAWINDPYDDTCYNTRTRALVRDSRTPVAFVPDHPCLVAKGTWRDPYTNVDLFDPIEIQIDHVVPLKNAYTTGAWKWTNRKRCLYANFMNNPNHLLSVIAHENMSKGSKAPDEYVPPNPQFICQYLRDWLEIKTIWALEMTPSEADSIRNQLQANHCELKKLTIEQSYFLAQKNATETLQSSCKMNESWQAAELAEEFGK